MIVEIKPRQIRSYIITQNDIKYYLCCISGRINKVSYNDYVSYFEYPYLTINQIHQLILKKYYRLKHGSKFNIHIGYTSYGLPYTGITTTTINLKRDLITASEDYNFQQFELHFKITNK